MRKFNEKSVNLRQNLGQILCVKNLNLRQGFKLFCSEKSLILKQIFCEIFYLKNSNLRQNLKKLAGLFGLFVLPFAFCACSLAPSPQPNPTTYILKANDKIVLDKPKEATKSIKIAPIQSVLYLRTNEITYIKDNELSSYSKHLWKSSPVNALSVLLSSKFEKNRLFQVVLNANSQIQADLLLELRFDAFEQVFYNNKSAINLALSASLIDNKSKKLLGVQHFRYNVSVEKIEPSAAVEGFDEALNALGDDMVLWINSLL